MDTHLNPVQKTSVRFKRAICVGLASALLAMSAVPAMADGKGTVTATSLYVRKTASTEAKALCSVRKGQRVTILDTDGDWYKVKTGETIGYCAKQYIDIEAQSAAESRQEDLGTVASLGDAPATSRPGDEGNKVLKLQKALTIKGFYSGRLSGHYGDLTKEAVRAFQKSKGLSTDGIAGKKTIAALFGQSAANDAGASDKSYKTEKLDWYHGGNGKIPNGATITIKDVGTGKTFKAKRRFGTNHLDAEPIDAQATEAMKAIYGGSWSWSRRAVLVLYDGRVYAGSMNGMPHAEEDENIKDNQFDGVFCIHFFGSKTHGSDKVDKEHQNQVAKAMKAAW